MFSKYLRLAITDNIANINKTEILYGMNDIMEKINIFIQNTITELNVMFDLRALSMLVTNPKYRDGLKHLLKRGCKIRCITGITSDNIGSCKEILNLVSELRHLEGIKGGIAINQSEYIATSVIEKGQSLTELYHSNLAPVVEQGQYIFDTLWRNSIPAIKKLRELEEGIVPAVIESISDAILLQKKVVELLRSANKEILVIFSSINAFHRQKSAGSIDILKEIGLTKPKVKIKILTPNGNDIEDICKELRKNSNLKYKFIEPIIKATILVVDRNFSIVVELKDDNKKTIAEAMGLATYSNSDPTVLTYAVVFDALWNQTSMYEQLQIHDRMQKEFIDTVAHELRTPLTPIIGLTKHVKDKLENKDQRRLLDIVIDNGKKLQALSENILVLTKMEGNMLHISKEVFNLNSVILDAIKDYKVRLEKIQYINNQNKKKIHFELYGFDSKCMVNADRYRISQVIFNLIENAINFILDKEGSISISLEKKAINGTAFVFVQIKDNGEGIHSEILSRLFTKFATKSFYGSGLGLYISKHIIEMHQGSIWGKNNEYGKGAIFSFSLPVTN